MKKENKIKIFCLIVFIVLILIFIQILIKNKISSVEEYQEMIKSFGCIGPVVIALFQAFQVVIPVIPSHFGYAAGAISFGTFVGFLCNYVGISAGSIIAYFLAKKYGKNLVIYLFSEKQYLKWKAKIEEKKNYDKFLFIATLLPLFPDDLLCYFSGLMDMKEKKFIWIIILGKPWCILAYSIAFGLIK